MIGSTVDSMETTTIHSMLNSVGITSNYTGFFYASFAISIAIKDPEALLKVTKNIYQAVADKCGTNWKNVERNIRTITGIAWSSNRRQLEEMANCKLSKRLSPSQFIAIMASAVANTTYKVKPACLE